MYYQLFHIVPALKYHIMPMHFLFLGFTVCNEVGNIRGGWIFAIFVNGTPRITAKLYYMYCEC